MEQDTNLRVRHPDSSLLSTPLGSVALAMVTFAPPIATPKVPSGRSGVDMGPLGPKPMTGGRSPEVACSTRKICGHRRWDQWALLEHPPMVGDGKGATRGINQWLQAPLPNLQPHPCSDGGATPCTGVASKMLIQRNAHNPALCGPLRAPQGPFSNGPNSLHWVSAQLFMVPS